MGSPRFSQDNGTLIVQDLDSSAPRLLFWDLSDRKYRLTLSDAYYAVTSPNGRVIATVETKQNRTMIALRDPNTGQLIRVLDYWKERIGAMAFDPSGKLLAAVGRSTGMKVWDVATGELRYILGANISRFADEEDYGYGDFGVFFSDDGMLVALVVTPLGRQAVAEIWEVASGKDVDLFLIDYASAIYFTDKTMIAIDDYRSEYTLFRGKKLRGNLMVLYQNSIPHEH